MKIINGFVVIGCDHGYGNTKTANHCFKTGVLRYDTEPTFAAYLLTFRNHYYLIGEGHKEFLADKTADEGLSAGLRRRRADQVS